MIKPCVLTIILLFMIIFILVLIFRNKFEEHFSGKVKHEHSRYTCKYPYSNQNIHLSRSDENTNFPFDNDDECSLDKQNLDIVDIHINNDDFGLKRNIHMVNPFNACCLRTCINDFTDVDNASGQLRREFLTGDNKPINLHYFFTSKCNECIENHWDSILMLHEAKICSDD